jgi:hypothetical protein
VPFGILKVLNLGPF